MKDVGERELLAIIFTDAVDSTSRTASDEDHSLRILLGDLDHIRNEAAVRGGTVLKNTGDGLLISFKSAVDAVECALAIQRGFANRPAATSFQHKVGVHIGDVVKKDGDIYGNGVNTASRLVGQCPAGGVCISSTVYELVKQKSQIGGLKLENFQLTNIEPPIGAYRLHSPGDEKKETSAFSGRSWTVGYLGVAVTLLLVLGGVGIPLLMQQCRSKEMTVKQVLSKDWASSANPSSIANVYHRIGNLGVGEEMVLNCWNDDEGRGKCGLFVNSGSHEQSGQLWDLSHQGSLRNSFLGNDREACFDSVDGSAWMGIQGASQNKISMVPNPDGRSYKLIQRGRFLSVDPVQLPRGEFRAYGASAYQGKYSDWILQSTTNSMEEARTQKDHSESAANPARPKMSPAIAQRLKGLREQNRAELAQKLEQKIGKACEIAERFPGSRVVVGQVKLADNKKDVRLVSAQMEILEDGLFAGEVRDLQSPIGFALQGYLPQQIQPMLSRGTAGYFNGNEYTFIAEPKGWKNASKHAEDMGGHLVTISSKEEEEYIEKFLRSQKGIPFCTWLGFSDFKKEGQWEWVTGEEVKYTNWGPGQPDNGYGCQNYAWIGWFNDGRWDDSLEGASLPYIIESDNYKEGMVDVGDITLQPLEPSDGASLNLKIEGNDEARSYTIVSLHVEPGAINTPHNGTSPRGSPGWEPPTEASPNEKGEVLMSRLSPGKYYLRIEAPNAVIFEKRITLILGQSLDLGNVWLLNKEKANK